MTDPTYPKIYPQSALCQIAMVSNPTFTSWQKRNGLLTRPVGKHQRNYYSTAEICVARCMVVLVNNGVNAERAAKIAMHTLGFFEKTCEVDGGGMISDNIYIFSDDRVRIADRDEQLHAMTGGREGGIGECGIVLDLGCILLPVMVGIHNWNGMGLKLEGANLPRAHESFDSQKASAPKGKESATPSHPLTKEILFYKVEQLQRDLESVTAMLRSLNSQGRDDDGV